VAHPLDSVGFLFFEEPDGNGRAVQQISSRAGRENPVAGRSVPA
jgi:hypothetical protein